MVQGYPLQYYQPYTRYGSYYSMTEISEEIMMPSSPYSAQSDSDTSMSSIDVGIRTLVPQSPTLVSSTTKSTNLNTNLDTKTGLNGVKCGWIQCGLWFESLDKLASHVSKAHASSGPSGLFYCGWEGCSRNNKGFNARYKMLVHVRTHTNEKPHQCCQCDKSFSRAENLKIHSRSHSGEKPYGCPVPGCNKAYSNSSDRFKHTRTHQVEKPYLCKVPGCPKRYTDPSSLRKHVKTYKHFTNETNDGAKTNQVETIEKEETVEKNILNCSCSHACCLKSCLTKAAEIFKLGALINFSSSNLNNLSNLDDLSLNKLFLDPLKSQEMYSQSMDCDTPLDLTVHRK